MVYPWLQRNLANGRLAFVRHFDYAINGDWVFAVTRNLPEWQKLRAPEPRDLAGFTPEENLNRLLVTHQPTYNTSTFGRVESWYGVRRPRTSGLTIRPDSYSVR